MKKINNLKLTTSDIDLSKHSLPLTHLISKQESGSLKDTVILHINHALSDVYALNEFLVDNLKAKVFLITTPYNNTTYDSRKYDYLFINRQSNTYKTFFNGRRVKLPSTSSDLITIMHEAIIFALDHIKKTYKNKKVIVLQDGGYSAGVSRIFEKYDPFQKMNNLLGMIEQTQGGTRLFKKKSEAINLNYPVITISRSLIKMRVESHFVAQRIMEEVNRTIYKMGYFLNFKSVLLAGYGIIGRQLAGYLSGANAKTTIIETHPDIKKLAESEGYRTITKIGTEHLDKSFCLIGVTGKCVFGIEEFLNFLESKNKFYFLASGSSKRYEFEGLIDLFESPPNKQKLFLKTYPLLNRVKNKNVIRKNNGVLEYTCQYNGLNKSIYLLAEGFPINLFDNEIQSVPDRAIDPIQALLTLSVVRLKQSYSKLAKGLSHVSDPEIIKKLKIDEEEMLSEWFYLNDISAYRGKPFDFFKPHPLEKLLMKT